MRKFLTAFLMLCAFMCLPFVTGLEVQLEITEKRMIAGIIITGIVVIIILSLLIVMLIRSRKRIKAAKEKIENLNALRETFIDADDSLIYLKDENLKYVFVNKAFESILQKESDDIIGKDDYALTGNTFAEKQNQTDTKVLKKGTLIATDVEWNGKIFKTTKFPVKLLNGKFGVGAYIKDITEERRLEKKQEKRHEKILYRNKILADVLNRSFASKQEQLDYVLHQACELTESKYGYIYFYDEDNREFTLNSWTRGVMNECDIPNYQTKYRLEKTGIWGEVVRQRKPIVVNEFEEPNPLKKGYPEGHVHIKKFMSVPVTVENKIVAVVGFANKQTDYDNNDVYEIILLMSGIWNAVKRREAQENLFFERKKYLQTLISIGDGVMVVDKSGRIEMLNLVAEKMTGWGAEETRGKNYKEVFILLNENPELSINDPIEGVFQTNCVQQLGNHAVLISKEGIKHCLEDSAAPIKDEKGTTVGVVLVFRDVTDKKEQEEKIEYLSFHDSLTGLYNRRFFEEELSRLDTEKNLPLSIIMGDVNGLKLTNDIFGHTYGDMLLEKIAKVLRKVCKPDDIIARWGGDEFVILLPNTNLEMSEHIISEVKKEYAKEHIKAIKGSISMGAEIKQSISESLFDVLNKAEEKMYLNKTLERDLVKSGALDSIIQTLHNNSPREKEHSVSVSELCRKMGTILKLPDIEIKKLKDAGYLHDIGKIVLEPKLLNRDYSKIDMEWNEIKKHPIIGYRILNSFDHTLDLAEIVLAHQERWDGTGYPKGLKGEEIPLLSRIIALAESYERKLHASYDLQPMTKGEAIKSIREKSGQHFDPVLTEIFINMLENNNGNDEEI